MIMCSKNVTFLEQCQATNEEEIFEAQDKRSLFPLGWIHVSFLSVGTGYSLLSFSKPFDAICPDKSILLYHILCLASIKFKE